MEQALAKVRPHSSSKLAHQKTPATLLRALEATFRDQNADNSPTAYFAALITTLEGTLQKNDTDLGDGDVLPAELYLLALIAPFVPQPIIRSNLNTLLSLTAPLFPRLLAYAPPLRSQIALYHVVLLSLDRSQLETQGIRQTFASILQLCLDSRPKVRRKAADLVKDVLSTPPNPMARHPYAERVAEWVKSSLTDTSGGLTKSARNPSEPSCVDNSMYTLAFLRPILRQLPPPTLPSITSLLLSLPRLGNPYLSQSAYSILSDIFAIPVDSEHVNVNGHIPNVLKAVLLNSPSKTDKILLPTWLHVLGNAMLVYRKGSSEACANELGKVWKTVWLYLESPESSIRKAAAETLDLLSRCITPSLIMPAIEELDRDEKTSELGKIIAHVTKSLHSLGFAGSMAEVLSVVSSLIKSTRYRVTRMSPTAAESLLLPLIRRVGDLRIQKGFEYKEAADATLATAMGVVGPQVMLGILPLHLEPSDRQTGLEPRAHLLPLLSNPHPSPLSHFISYFVPLSERMFNLQQKAESEGRQSEAKVWSVLVAQIWTGLSGYCWAPYDLKESLNPAFSQILSQLLYSHPELRPAVLKALKTIVDSNVRLASSEQTVASSDAISPEEASQNVVFLRSQAESWLAVFFNVFGSVGRDGRGLVCEVISTWSAIAGEHELTKAYSKVVHLFQQNVVKPHNPPSNDDDGGRSITTVTQDLLILLLPYLSSNDAAALLQLSLSAEVLGCNDHGVQKRGYKILAKLCCSGNVPVDAETVLRRLDELSDCLAPAAKKDRFILLTALIPLIPASAMHVIPSVVPEAVLGTKEPSEKARSAAFELILAMGRKMSEGGVVKRNMVDGMSKDGVEATASVDEFMTMVAGGLAGASPHMISATVTAIGRLVFEFKSKYSISTQLHTEIFTTLLVFLSSANREIVKSILGFIKLAVHTIPVDLLRPHLPQLVPALLEWSHDHKNHFKAKVRHIFERMLRRFGWNDVYSCAGENSAAKVLVNIKKRKDRAKRRKALVKVEDDNTDFPKPPIGDAFEDVLYGSESELDESSDEQTIGQSEASAKQKGSLRLRVDNHQPMDLLQGVAPHITKAQSNRRLRVGQDAAHFKTEDETGRMIIDDPMTSSGTFPAAGDVAGTAYHESITSIDGFTRGLTGRVKFNKDTRKRRRDNADIEEDVEMVDGDTGAEKGRSSKRRSDVKLGHDFKAKRAGGDVRKGGVDPYAYMTLSLAAKKSGRGGRVRLGIAGKR